MGYAGEFRSGLVAMVISTLQLRECYDDIVPHDTQHSYIIRGR